MDIYTAIENLISDYGDIAGIDRVELKHLINKGLSEGFSVRQIYNGIRLVLSVKYQRQEIFSSSESIEMMKISENKLFFKIAEVGSKPIKTHGKIFYFPDKIN